MVFTKCNGLAHVAGRLRGGYQTGIAGRKTVPASLAVPGVEVCPVGQQDGGDLPQPFAHGQVQRRLSGQQGGYVDISAIFVYEHAHQMEVPYINGSAPKVHTYIMHSYTQRNTYIHTY